MITGRDLIFISSVEWDFLWQVHQEIASKFAAAGNRVLYIENTGVRSPGIADAKRIGLRLRRWAGSLISRRLREVAPNLLVLSPLVMPPFGSRGGHLLNLRVFLSLIKRRVKRMGMRDPLIWTYLPTDTALDLIRLMKSPASMVVYYCGADFPLLATNRDACKASEDELIRSSDLVLATCAQLERKCQKLRPDVYRIPSLVDLSVFPLSANGSKASSTPARPVIGYVGGLHRYVDYDLLIAMAQARPEWSWVFAGAVNTNVERLLAQPNVTYLGQLPHANLAEHLRKFDVCLVPYLNSELTATVVPMKVNEYLAMGKPIVSSPLPAVVDFNQRHNALFIAPNECAPFLAAIEQALMTTTDHEAIERRRTIAALSDSQHQLDLISELIERRSTKLPASQN